MSKQAFDAPRRSIFMLDADDPRIVIVGRDTDDGPNHPRYDTRAHNAFDEDIVKGMMMTMNKQIVGVRKAIEVIKISDDRYEVVDGRQRVINAREASRRLKAMGLPGLRIPVLPPVNASDAEIVKLMVLSNEHTIQDTPMGRAHKAQMLKSLGYSNEEIGPLMRCSAASIGNYLSLMDLIPELQALIAQGAVPATKGYELAKASPEKQAKFVKAIVEGKPPKPSTTRVKTPNRAVLKKVLAAGRGKLPKDFLLGLTFAIGIGVPKVDGLAEVLKEIGVTFDDEDAEPESEEDAV